MSEALPLVTHLSTLLWLLGACAFTVFSVWLSAVDLISRRLPNRLVGWATGVTLGLLLASCAVRLPTASRGLALQDAAQLLGGAAALLSLFVLLFVALPGGIGGGDVKIAPLAGGALGFFGGVWALTAGALLACVIAAIWGAVLRSRGAEERRIPFAPCLFGGAWIAIAVVPAVSRILA